MSLTGQSIWSSTNLIYSFKVSGRAPNPFSHILSGRLSHPGRDSYTGLASLYCERLAGIHGIHAELAGFEACDSGLVGHVVSTVESVGFFQGTFAQAGDLLKFINHL